MFQGIAARYECGSIVITTNRVFHEWGQIFDVDNTLSTANRPLGLTYRRTHAWQHPESTNSAAQKHAVPSGITLC